MSDRGSYYRTLVAVAVGLLGLIALAACIALFRVTIAARRSEELMVNANTKLNDLSARLAKIERAVRPDVKDAYEKGKKILRSSDLEGRILNLLDKKLPRRPAPKDSNAAQGP